MDREDTASIYNMPKWKSDKAKPGPNGITEKPKSENTRVTIGPRKKRIKLACVGEIYSFSSNFKASAKACNKP